ncbi:hypothetical protein BLS_006217 [Venturia inaequalis]|uniref:Uncharacterized protein n=2 Tax=Venturia inaequalis TaxID=5025 RepID=A0A8H3UEG3_VENIN|nr:hypothetical protein BLS_006217 [Venturia inaequalis]
MDAFTLQILHLLLSIFQMMALGSPHTVITILQHLSAVLVFAIFEYFSLRHPRHAHFRRSKIPNLWRLFVSLVCLASLFSLGSSSSAICLFRSLFSWLLAGIGGIDAWNFECPREFRVRKPSGTSSSTNPVSTPNAPHAIDQLGYLLLNPQQTEDYNAHCDFVEGLLKTIRNRDATIAQLEIGIKHRDITISRQQSTISSQQSTISSQQSKLNEQEIELDYWRKHRCPVPGLGQPSLGSLLHRIASLENSLDKSRNANGVLQERLQKSYAKSENTASEAHQPCHKSQQAQIVSEFFSLPSSQPPIPHQAHTVSSYGLSATILPPMVTGIAKAIDNFACYTPHTVSGHGFSARSLPPMVKETSHTSNPPPQPQIPSANADPPADKEAPSAPPAAAAPSSKPPPPPANPAAPALPGRKIKSVKSRVGREMRTDNDDLDDDEFDHSYIPPAMIDFACICEGMSNVQIQLHADQVFGDLASTWLDRKRDVLKGRVLECIEYGQHSMELDMSARIDSNALILKEEKGTVYMTLKG